MNDPNPESERTVPLVIYLQGVRHEIGTATIGPDGYAVGRIEHDAGVDLVGDVDMHFSILPKRDPYKSNWPSDPLLNPRFAKRKKMLVPNESLEDPAQIVSPMAQAIGTVAAYYNDMSTTPTGAHIDTSQVQLLEFSKRNKDWFARLTTTLHDGLFYELTFTDEQGTIHIDVLTKVDSVTVYGDQGELYSMEKEKLNPEGPGVI